jgi:hypothetical protein
MNETLYQGWTPPVKKVCTRCLGPNENQLQELCDTCRTGDELAAWLDEHCAEDSLWKDEQLTKSINQPI